MFRERLTTAKRFLQSYLVLVVYLLLPTMRLRTRYALVVAKLPVWRNFDFFNAMFKLLDEQKSKGAGNE